MGGMATLSSAVKPKILPSSLGLHLTPGLAGEPLCVPNFEFSRSNTCPIKTDLAEVSLTRDLLGINILSVVLE